MLAANQQGEVLVEGLPQWKLPGVIDMSIRHLNDTQLAQLWLGNAARGVFFHDLPMRYYGGSALGYFACFGVKKAILKVLREPKLRFLDLNDPKQACPISGCLPLHAVTANGMRDMYNFLCEARPAPLLSASAPLLSASAPRATLSARAPSLAAARSQGPGCEARRRDGGDG